MPDPRLQGASADGWLYDSRDRSLGVWATVHDCDSAASRRPNRFEGG